MSVTTTLDAQHTLIGSMLIDERCVPLVMSKVSEDDFSGTCRTVFGTIRELFLAGTRIDPVVVLHRLGNLPEYREFVRQCMEITPTAANAGHYAHVLREQVRAERIRSLGVELSGMTDLIEMRKLLEDAAHLAADRQDKRVFTMTELLTDFAERHSGGVDYLPWPIAQLTQELEIEPGDFVIVGGRPSTGKTALTIQAAFHWACNRYKVGYFSLETNRRKITDRLVSHAARINKGLIRHNQMTDTDWDLFADASSRRMAPAWLEVVEAAGMSVADIQAYTVMRGYQIIVIDYLQLIEETGHSTVEAVTKISKKLHTLAQSKGVTVVALSQLSRMDKQNPRHATMMDLRESGQIEQDADVILLLNPMDPKKPVQGQNRLLRVEKNKEGGLAQMELEFEGHFQTFKRAPQTLGEHMERRGYEPPPPPPPPEPQWQPTAADYEYVGEF